MYDSIRDVGNSLSHLESSMQRIPQAIDNAIDSTDQSFDRFISNVGMINRWVFWVFVFSLDFGQYECTCSVDLSDIVCLYILFAPFFRAAKRQITINIFDIFKIIFLIKQKEKKKDIQLRVIKRLNLQKKEKILLHLISRFYIECRFLHRNRLKTYASSE